MRHFITTQGFRRLRKRCALDAYQMQRPAHFCKPPALALVALLLNQRAGYTRPGRTRYGCRPGRSKSCRPGRTKSCLPGRTKSCRPGRTKSCRPGRTKSCHWPSIKSCHWPPRALAQSCHWPPLAPADPTPGPSPGRVGGQQEVSTGPRADTIRAFDGEPLHYNFRRLRKRSCAHSSCF